MLPAWGDRLPADSIWQLVAYLESLGGAMPPAGANMPALGGPQPSTTGDQPADQSPKDAAHEGLIAANAHGGT